MQSVLQLLRNKYLLTGVVFLVWLVFFDHNDLFLQRERRQELSKLQDSKAYYTRQIEAIGKDLSSLRDDPAAMEKAARERYLMKKDNEDLFLVTTP